MARRIQVPSAMQDPESYNLTQVIQQSKKNRGLLVTPVTRKWKLGLAKARVLKSPNLTLPTMSRILVRNRHLLGNPGWSPYRIGYELACPFCRCAVAEVPGHDMKPLEHISRLRIVVCNGVSAATAGSGREQKSGLSLRISSLPLSRKARLSGAPAPPAVSGPARPSGW